MSSRAALLLAILLVWTGGSSSAQAGAEAAPAELFRFGLLADVQYADKDTAGARRYREALPKLEACVAAWNAEPLAFGVQLGDLIDGRAELQQSREDLERVLAVLGELRAPLQHVLGNHCLEVPRAELMAALGLESARRSFARDGWRFLALDALEFSTCGWPAGSPEHAAATQWLAEHPRGAEHPSAYAWNGALGEPQRRWLAAQLAAAELAGERVVVLSHLPTLAAASSEHHILWDHAEVLEILQGSPATFAFINGHDHGGGYALVEGIHHWTVPGMVEAPADGNAYAVVEVYRDRLVVRGHGTVAGRVLLARDAGAARPEDSDG